MKIINISTPPTDYGGWLEYFENFSDGIPNDNFEQIISQGKCPEYRGIKKHLHPQIEKSVNQIINSCISELKRDLKKHFEEEEIVGLHIPFIRFSKEIKKCTFFMYIPFLDQSFKEELYSATKYEITQFWNEIIKILKKDSYNNPLLEEELFLIKRIQLFN